MREPGVWINIVHFCGLQKRGDSRPGSTAAGGSCEQCILPSNCLRSDGALNNVGIDFDTPIDQEAFESGPPGVAGALPRSSSSTFQSAAIIVIVCVARCELSFTCSS